jgi:hypothetical protein
MKQMEESLMNSIQLINLSTQMALKGLVEKTQDPITMERSGIWFPKARQIVNLTRELYNYIDSIKKETGIRKNSIDSINTRLSVYKEDLLKLDPSIQLEFKHTIGSIKPIPENAKASLLIRLQNDIKIVENRMITYCDIRTSVVILYDDFTQIVIGQKQ